MKKQLLIFLLFWSFSVKAQKIYIWCPENFQVKPRIGLSEKDTINVVFFDGRAIPKKNKIECTSDQLFQSILSQLKVAYPSAILKKLPETEYYSKQLNTRRILIKIGVAAYHSGFGTDISGAIGAVGGQFASMVFPKGQWNAITAYYLQVFKNGTVASKEISNLSSKSNMWGYKSARNALNDTYNKSNQELLFFVDQELTR